MRQQSPGDLYDSLEIDEILALRVMTLTDAEKAEARGTDARAAAIIDRCDALSPETMGRLHGQMRPVEPTWPTLSTPPSRRPRTGGAPWWDPAADASVDPWNDPWRWREQSSRRGPRCGCTRRGAPMRRTCSSTAAAHGGRVFADVDGGFHLAVTLDDDPAAGELMWQGRYLYFRPEEVEPLPRARRGAGMSGRTLVAGIGNIFLSDDAFGVEVAHRLSAGPCLKACGSRTTASEASTSPTSCSRATTRSS